VPMPVRLVITRDGGQVEERVIPVDVRLSGARTTSLNVAGTVTKVEIDPTRVFPDRNRTNNVWTR
jgi:hypothetical protein